MSNLKLFSELGTFEHLYLNLTNAHNSQSTIKKQQRKQVSHNNQ